MLENKYINFDKYEMFEIQKTFKTRKLAGTSEVVTQYEYKLAAFFKVKHAIALSSGTSSLHALLYAYNIGPGDEVILSPSAPVMSALPILAVGAQIVFVDNTKESFGFDIDDLKNKTTKRTKMIVSVPMWGYAINSGEIRDYAKSQNIPFIEDVSHCHGSIDEGKYMGTFCDAGFFSTQERKLISTGEGGFVTTNDDKVANRLIEVRDFGKPVSELSRFPDHIGEYGYLFGLNFRITALSAAIGIAQIDKLNKKIESRTKNANRIKESISDIGWLREVAIKNESQPNYYAMLLMITSEDYNNSSVGKRLFDSGIVSDTYRFKIKPLYKMPIFKKFASDCPNSESLLRKIITLPTHEGLTSDDLALIVKSVKSMEANV
jgi:degT/dnrJ/eryC1/strS aminotransferase